MPTILCEIDDSNGFVTNKYYYADAQILKQEQAHYEDIAVPYYYFHDRLGSVRLVVDANGIVKNSYTYNPFGADLSTADCDVVVYNPFKFTGQWFDPEIGQYYLRARMYDPALGRFTARDPERGKYEEPMTLHRYL